MISLALPPGGSFRLEQTSGEISVILPGATTPPELALPEDPRHLVEQPRWSDEGQTPRLVVPLGSGRLTAAEAAEGRLHLSFADASGHARGYVLGPEDVLEISVVGEDDLSGAVTIDLGGDIKVELIGTVRAAGRTPDELAMVIGDALAREYLTDPLVSVEVKTYRNQFVTVTGSVANPGRTLVRGPTPLSRVISLVGGFSLQAGYSLTVSRLLEDGSTRSFVVRRDELEAGRDDPQILADDLITVKSAEVVYLDGEVGQPGAVILSPGLTLMRALAISRGTTPWANESQVQIHREVGGHRVLETHNLKKIRAHKMPDPSLRDGDVIVVPRRFL